MEANGTAWGSAVGSGTTGPFSIPFSLYAQDHLTVITVTSGNPYTNVLGTDYTFTSWVPDNKGQVAAPAITFTNAVASGVLIVFLLTPPVDQLTSYTNGPYYPAMYEAGADLLTQMVAMLNERSGKSLRAPDTEQASAVSMVLPPIAVRKLGTLAFDINGNPIVTPGVFSSFIQSFLLSANLAAAQATMQQPVVTDWVAYTPVISWTGNATATGMWRRVGDTIEVQFAVAVGSSAPTPLVTPLTVGLPNGLTVDLTKQVSFFAIGINNYNATQMSRMYESANTAQMTDITSVTVDLNSTVYGKFSLPITGWS